MPATSKAQQRLMQAAEHGATFSMARAELVRHEFGDEAWALLQTYAGDVG